ncbi:rhodanese-like domain-containing protein [Flavivirga rizhaonensis]|uniref:Rhodanese-like domain-containing protein n=1 Tax=Flavivirga rizhaonensis TaxID=2559571 RepID=A0A4S1E1A0_9FLAO|nr:rhodanese-like domain-containing protein [Flavivirga rizhaonensis]TGV04115.1 rhodanese-like domain-containing protein [Flavivirga rizhaonensis]
MNRLFFYIFICFAASGFSQNNLKSLLKKYNKEQVPYIYVKELKKQIIQPILLDARELSEYNVSHLKNAIYVGYNKFKIENIQKKIPNKDTKIVVYCSLGIRSDSIANNLKKAGYNNVENLYGSIFEWKNNNLPVYSAAEKITDSIHAFSKAWSKWVKKGVKVYD